MLKSVDAEVEERVSLKRRYLKHMQEHTKCHCFTALFIILALSAIVSQAYEVLQGDADFADPDAEAVIAFDSVYYSRLQFDIAEQLEDEEANEEESITFAYQWKDGRNEDILTPENLRTFCNIERIVFGRGDYGFAPCDTSDPNTTLTCVQSGPLSITSTIYRTHNASFNYETCDLLPEEVVTNFTSLMYSALGDDVSSEFRFFVNDLSKTTITRSVLIVSNPDFDTLVEKVIEIEEDLFEFFDMEATALRSVYRDTAVADNIECSFFNIELLNNEFERLLPSDFIMAFGSMTFVGIWMGIYTRSLFLTVACTSYILFSIPVSLFVYKIIFRILYFDFIHILVIFIILGIGADGTFVVIDAYKQSRLLMDDEYERLVYAWSRATATVFNTSFTTVVAFVVTGFTPLIPISTFGIFAALCIATNFVFVCTIVQSTVINWERWFVKTPVEDIDPELKRENSEQNMHGEFKSDSDAKATLEALVDTHNRTFENYYIPFVLKYKKALTGLGLVIGILGMVGITQVSQLTKPEQWFPTDHSQANFIEDLVLEYLSGEEEEYALMTVFWGVDDIERDIPSRYAGDIENYDDKVIFDDALDISDYDAQLAIIEMCELIENRSCDLETCLGFTTIALPETATYNGTCTMRDFHEWYNFTEDLEDINSTVFNARMLQFVTENPDYIPHVGFIDGRIKFFSIEYRLTLTILAPGTDVELYIDIMDEIVKEYSANSPATAKSVNFASEDFVEYSLEVSLVETVTRGLAITFPIVFAVLLLATGNWILAGFSVVAIAFIVITVMGFVFGVIGWELGIAESIVSIMIVGLSVDYAIHLGHMYTVAGNTEGLKSREDKFHYAVLTMGPTVLAGGLTTLGAGAFLFGAQITFFGKMGVLLTLTVCCSLFYSLIFLMAVAAWLGPEGTTANLKYPSCKKE